MDFVTEDMIDAFTVGGPPDVWIDRLNRIAALGVEHINVFLLGPDRAEMGGGWWRTCFRISGGADMPRATVNGVSLYYDEWGAGHPLLLLMGFGDGLHAWANQIPAFAERFRTVALDHRGSGESEAPRGGYAIPQFADDAVGLLDRLGVERAHVLGYSMGGRVGLEMAARHPGRVSALVLAASAPRPMRSTSTACAPRPGSTRPTAPRRRRRSAR